ncbi:MAG: cytochrome P450 [Deltaproteobacteria bacterium]|nr:cytochrome P450 [Deltaproteobacteria bacterium]MBW2389655.1 cytochrome P450 [Deltaproteobacteria bacterium]MBW2725020.1 cytochrome P450 [Deltaproteobacteria bacterium]
MVEFSPYAYEFHEDPYPIYRRLREEAPVYHNEKAEFWALSRHRDVLAAFKDVKRFSNSHGVSIDPAARGAAARAGTSFLAMDPPEHTGFRSLVARSFTPRRVAALEPSIRELAARHLDALVGRDGFDAIGDFAGKLPMDVISEMMGVDEADRAELRSWADAMVHRDEGVHDVPPEGVEAFGKIRRYFQDLLAKLRKRPGDDLLSSLLGLEAKGPSISEDDLLSFCNLMITAGNETTTKLLGNALYWLWRNPEQKARVLRDPALIPQWVEETLRYDNSTQTLMRLTLADVEFAETTIPAGEHVLLLVGSANRDPEVFEQPDQFDIARDTRDMLSFGRGTHFCMGAALARLEARVAFEEWCKRFSDYEIQTDGIARVHSVNVRGFSTLPIKV